MGRKIFVFGVTGLQGRSVAESLLDGGYEVHGLTRNADSKSANELNQLGVTLVQGDFADASTYEPALAGMDGAFLNVDFWAHYKGGSGRDAKAIEITQTKAAVDALQRAGTPHIVHSTLETLMPRFELPHFDSKAHMTTYIKSLDLPATHLFLSAYYENLLHLPVARNPHGDGYTMTFINSDETRVPSFAAKQTGLWVRAALDQPDKWIRKDMYACADKPTVSDMARALSDATGHKIEPAHHTTKWLEGNEARASMPEELWLNYLVFEKGLLERDVQKSREAAPGQWDFHAWAEHNADAFKQKIAEAK